MENKIKLKLTTLLPRIFIHVLRQFNPIEIRNPVLAGVSFSSPSTLSDIIPLFFTHVSTAV